MAFTRLLQHLLGARDHKIHFVVCPCVGSDHRHLCSQLGDMDAHFIAGPSTPRPLMRRVCAVRVHQICVLDLTHVKHRASFPDLLLAVESIHDGTRLKQGKKVVVFCPYNVYSSPSGQAAGHDIDR